MALTPLRIWTYLGNQLNPSIARRAKLLRPTIRGVCALMESSTSRQQYSWLQHQLFTTPTGTPPGIHPPIRNITVHQQVIVNNVPFKLGCSSKYILVAGIIRVVKKLRSGGIFFSDVYSAIAGDHVSVFVFFTDLFIVVVMFFRVRWHRFHIRWRGWVVRRHIGWAWWRIGQGLLWKIRGKNVFSSKLRRGYVPAKRKMEM